MKSESQHLDFLVSQYVDGCLEGTNKKSVEQKLLTDPVARKLYDEHREVQDLLDDWGNRIPLINWDEFDQKLALKLAQENVGVSTYSIFRRWAKPVAAAAALFIAASIGYGWHAWWGAPSNHVKIDSPVAVQESRSRVAFPDLDGTTQPSFHSAAVAEGEARSSSPQTKHLAVGVSSGTSNVAARDALEESVYVGLGDLSDSQKKLLQTPAGSVAVTLPEVKKEEKPAVSFP